jgi:hypothetical protein
VNLLEPGGSASYNALLTRLEKLFTGGLTFLSSCTWAHNIDQAGQISDLFATAVANPNDRRAERASAYLDRKHSFTTSFTWELPFGKDRAFGSQWGRALEAIAGGWQVGGIVSLRSGFPVAAGLSRGPSKQRHGQLRRPHCRRQAEQSDD